MSLQGRGILVLYHCKTNTGYAIGTLERTFYKMALRLVQAESRIFHGYKSLDGGLPEHLPYAGNSILEVKLTSEDATTLATVEQYIRQNRIHLVFGFDLPLSAPILKALRAGGAIVIISYWGASISSPYPWWLRPLRRMQYILSASKPDHFIFESDGMRHGATYGTCIPKSNSSVCRLGVDTDRYAPPVVRDDYAYEVFNIPKDRKIFFFSGHMERRKGVHVLVSAFAEIINGRGRSDVHLLVLGNQPGEEDAFLSMVEGTRAASHVTFGGYRSDIAKLHKSIYAGVIASTGWDSFTLSAVEMTASGLPLLVSDLTGLNEAVEHGVTGFCVPTGDVTAWAESIAQLADNEAMRNKMGVAARSRALLSHAPSVQLACLESTVRMVWHRRTGAL